MVFEQRCLIFRQRCHAVRLGQLVDPYRAAVGIHEHDFTVINLRTVFQRRIGRTVQIELAGSIGSFTPPSQEPSARFGPDSLPRKVSQSVAFLNRENTPVERARTPPTARPAPARPRRGARQTGRTTAPPIRLAIRSSRAHPTGNTNWDAISCLSFANPFHTSHIHFQKLHETGPR